MQFSRRRSNKPALGLATLAAMVLLAHAAIVAVFLFYFPGKPPRSQPQAQPEMIITLAIKPQMNQLESRQSARAIQLPQSASLPMQQKTDVQLAESPAKPPLANPDISSGPSAPFLSTEPTAAAVDQPPAGRENSKAAGEPATPQDSAAPDFNAAYLNNSSPPYPRIAVRQRIEGTVTLIVRVMPDGRASDVRIGQSSGSSALDETALKTVKDWRFVPARQSGVAVAADVQVPITFRLQ